MKARDEWMKRESEERELKELGKLLIRARAAERMSASQSRARVRANLLREEEQVNLTVFETRLGWMGIAHNAQGVVGLQLPRASREDTLRHLQREYPNGMVQPSAPREMMRELEEYAEGKRRVFDLPLNWSRIKPFQRAVLNAIQNIPFGETRSYAWVARAIGKPRASRAVGAALGANPIPIILPCHRVIGSDGGLHGYGGGLELKARLLKLEGAIG